MYIINIEINNRKMVNGKHVVTSGTMLVYVRT